MITDAIKEMLDAPLNQGRVSTRNAGRGRMVPYLEGWDVIACANAIFGYDGWSYDVLDVKQGGIWERNDNTVVLYQARVRVEALGAVPIDIGSSVTADDTPEGHDTAMKGAATDGLKRALRTFGAQFGNDLYDKNGPHDAAAQEQRQAPRQESALTASADGIDTVGALLTWALTRFQMTKDEVLGVLNVEKPSDIKNLSDAVARIEAAVAEVAGAR